MKPEDGVATVIVQDVDQTLPVASVSVQPVNQILLATGDHEKLDEENIADMQQYKTLVINGAFGICGAMTFNCLTNTMLCPLCLVGRVLGCMLGGCGEHIWFSYVLTDWRDTSIKVSPCLEFPVVN